MQLSAKRNAMPMKCEIKNKDFIVNGAPIKIISGAVHYFRNFPETWDDIFKKMVALGCNTVETYCAWNMHEKKINEYDFSGILNIAVFLKKAKEHGLMAIVRPGPYICAEWEFGGLPWWLQTLQNMEYGYVSLQNGMGKGKSDGIFEL